MKTAEELAREYTLKKFAMLPETMQSPESFRRAYDGFVAGYNEAMRWRNPKVELPESNELVQIEYRHMMRDGNSYSHDRYDPKEKTWNIEEIDNEIKVLYWRPIE